MESDIAAETEKELTSTSTSGSVMGKLLSTTNKEEKNDSNDTLPTSSTDASTSIQSTHLVSDDPISSTSSDVDSSKSKTMDNLSVDTVDKAAVSFEAELLGMSMEQSAEKIDENVDDLVNDLETLLGETSDTFVLTKKPIEVIKEETEVTSHEVNVVEEKLDNEVSSNTDTATTAIETEKIIEESSSKKLPESVIDQKDVDICEITSQEDVPTLNSKQDNLKTAAKSESESTEMATEEVEKASSQKSKEQTVNDKVMDDSGDTANISKEKATENLEKSSEETPEIAEQDEQKLPTDLNEEQTKNHTKETTINEQKSANKNNEDQAKEEQKIGLEIETEVVEKQTLLSKIKEEPKPEEKTELLLNKNVSKDICDIGEENMQVEESAVEEKTEIIEKNKEDNTTTEIVEINKEDNTTTEIVEEAQITKVSETVLLSTESITAPQNNQQLLPSEEIHIKDANSIEDISDSVDQSITVNELIESVDNNVEAPTISDILEGISENKGSITMEEDKKESKEEGLSKENLSSQDNVPDKKEENSKLPEAEIISELLEDIEDSGSTDSPPEDSSEPVKEEKGTESSNKSEFIDKDNQQGISEETSAKDSQMVTSEETKNVIETAQLTEEIMEISEEAKEPESSSAIVQSEDISEDQDTLPDKEQNSSKCQEEIEILELADTASVPTEVEIIEAVPVVEEPEIMQLEEKVEVEETLEIIPKEENESVAAEEKPEMNFKDMSVAEVPEIIHEDKIILETKIEKENTKQHLEETNDMPIIDTEQENQSQDIEMTEVSIQQENTESEVIKEESSESQKICESSEVKDGQPLTEKSLEIQETEKSESFEGIKETSVESQVKDQSPIEELEAQKICESSELKKDQSSTEESLEIQKMYKSEEGESFELIKEAKLTIKETSEDQTLVKEDLSPIESEAHKNCEVNKDQPSTENALKIQKTCMESEKHEYFEIVKDPYEVKKDPSSIEYSSGAQKMSEEPEKTEVIKEGQLPIKVSSDLSNVEKGESLIEKSLETKKHCKESDFIKTEQIKETERLVLMDTNTQIVDEPKSPTNATICNKKSQDKTITEPCIEQTNKVIENKIEESTPTVEDSAPTTKTIEDSVPTIEDNVPTTEKIEENPPIKTVVDNALTVAAVEDSASEAQQSLEEPKPVSEINIRRKTVEQDLEKVVCLSEESSDSDTTEPAINHSKPTENLPQYNKESTLIKIPEVDQYNVNPEIPNEETMQHIEDIPAVPSSFETMMAVASLQNETVEPQVERRLSEKEIREMEAIRMAVASITDSSQDTYDSYLVENSMAVDNIQEFINEDTKSEVIEACKSSDTSESAKDEDKVICKDSMEMKPLILSNEISDEKVSKATEEIKSSKEEDSSKKFDLIEDTNGANTDRKLNLESVPSPENIIEEVPESQSEVEHNKEVAIPKEEVSIIEEKSVKTRPKRGNKINEPLSINVEEEDKKDKNYSPKITIKPLKVPDEEVSTTSAEAEANKGSLKITITKQSDKMHSILKVYNPEDEDEVPQQDEPIPKLIIKPKIQQVEQQHSPKMTTRSSKAYSPTNTRCSSPRITIKPVTKPAIEAKPEIHSPLKITLKPIVKPEEAAKKLSPNHNPKIIIKPIPKPVEVDKEEIPKLTIKPVKRHLEEEDKDVEQERSSPKIIIKPVVKPQEQQEHEQSTTKLKIKPINSIEKDQMIKPIEDDVEEEVKERIVLKINKGNLPSPAKDLKKREYPEDEKLEKVAIKLKFSTTGGHTHIIQEGEETSNKRQRKDSGYSAAIKNIDEITQKRPLEEKISEKNKRLKNNEEDSNDAIKIIEPKLNSPIVISEDSRSQHSADSVILDESVPDVSKITQLASQTTHIGVSPVLTVGVATPLPTPSPKKRGRPRKATLEVREEFTPVETISPAVPSASDVSTPEATPSPVGRPKRSCRGLGQNVTAILGLKPRKPRGGGRGRGGKVNMGDREPPAPPVPVQAVPPMAAPPVETVPLKQDKDPKLCKGKQKEEPTKSDDNKQDLTEAEQRNLSIEETKEKDSFKKIEEPSPPPKKKKDEKTPPRKLEVTTRRQKAQLQKEAEEKTSKPVDKPSTKPVASKPNPTEPSPVLVDDDVVILISTDEEYSGKEELEEEFKNKKPIPAKPKNSPPKKIEEKVVEDKKHIKAKQEVDAEESEDKEEEEEEEDDSGDESDNSKRKEWILQRKQEAIKKCRAKRMEKLAKAAELKRKRQEQAAQQREARKAAEEAEKAASEKERANKRYGRYGKPKPQISLIDAPVQETAGTIKSNLRIFDAETAHNIEDDDTGFAKQLESPQKTSAQEPMIIDTEESPSKVRRSLGTEDVVMLDEETRMSADFRGSSRAQTPAKQPQTVPDIMVEDSQGSMGTEGGKSRSSKTPKMEVFQDLESLTADQLAEYSWNNQGPFMIQEQVAQYLGIKSFKRKYPNINRRPVDMQERDYLKDCNLVTETQCDLGLTAVIAQDILDIMYADFQDKFEDYCRCQRERQARELINKQKALNQCALKPGFDKLDILEQAVQSAAAWNKQFNKTRKEQRKAFMDLQTLTVHYPKSKIKPVQTRKIGHYPVALVPGQFTDDYQDYTPTELNNLPLNTMCYDEIKIGFESYSENSSSGSESDSDSSSSSSSESSCEEENCKDCVKKIKIDTNESDDVVLIENDASSSDSVVLVSVTAGPINA